MTQKARITQRILGLHQLLAVCGARLWDTFAWPSSMSEHRPPGHQIRRSCYVYAVDSSIRVYLGAEQHKDCTKCRNYGKGGHCNRYNCEALEAVVGNADGAIASLEEELVIGIPRFANRSFHGGMAGLGSLHRLHCNGFFSRHRNPRSRRRPRTPLSVFFRAVTCSTSIEHTRVFSWPIGRQLDPILSKRRLLHPLSAGCSRPQAPQRASAYWRHLRTAWRKRIKGDHEMICLAKCRSPGTTLFQRR